MIETFLKVVEGCNQHDHQPKRIDVQVSAWRKLFPEMIDIPLDHPVHLAPHPKCGNSACEQYWSFSMMHAGDEPGEFFGIPIRIVKDPPPPMVAVHE